MANNLGLIIWFSAIGIPMFYMLYKFISYKLGINNSTSNMEDDYLKTISRNSEIIKNILIFYLIISGIGLIIYLITLFSLL